MAVYNSPRWSGEVLDCSMPMTFDQYSRCSFDCLYCFAFFQRGLKLYNPNTGGDAADTLYNELPPNAVDPNHVTKIFDGSIKTEFADYVKDRTTVQWGGMSDPFDKFEKQLGVGLTIMQHLHKLKYPICFSTKGTWWLDDDRYARLFHNNSFWNVKISIINLDKDKAKLMERGVASPVERLLFMKRLSKLMGKNGGGVTLRLRPFIIGYSSQNDAHIELIRRAGEAGATALSTEFLCIESRTTKESRERFDAMSELMGINLLEFYKNNSPSATGYLRLNYKIKEKYVLEMEEACKKAGLRFYVSDAHWKNKCANGSCCGLGENWNYSKGQFTQALMHAKEHGEVHWSDISGNLPSNFDEISITRANGLNIARGNAKDRARFTNFSVADYMRYIWNNPNHPRSPYKYFYGLMTPKNALDKKGDVVYSYTPYGGSK